MQAKDERITEAAYYNLSNLLTEIIGRDIKCKGLKVNHGAKNKIDGVITIKTEGLNEHEKDKDKEEWIKQEKELILWMEFMQETLINHKEIESWTLGGANLRENAGNLCDIEPGYINEGEMDHMLKILNEVNGEIKGERIPELHWIRKWHTKDDSYREYELEYSMEIRENREMENPEDTWINEYEEHRDFVKEEFYIEGEPMGTNEEKPNERQEPFMLDIENGGQDIYQLE